MKSFLLLMMIGLLAGCASAPDDLRAIIPMGNPYAGHDCTQLEQVCNDTAKDIKLFVAIQNSKRSQDSFKVALDVLVFPVFWGIGNNDITDKLRQAMGNYQEACKKADLLKCDFKITPLMTMLQE